MCGGGGEGGCVGVGVGCVCGGVFMYFFHYSNSKQSEITRQRFKSQKITGKSIKNHTHTQKKKQQNYNIIFTCTKQPSIQK